MSIEVMKQALEALEELNKVSIGVDAVCLPGEIDTAMDALRTAIEQAEKQKPVAVVSGYYGGQCVILPTDSARIFNSGTAFYTHPPAAPVQDDRDWSLLEATQESLREHMAEIKRLKAIIEAAEKQEPVATYTCGVCGVSMRMESAAAQRQWVGLTPEQVRQCFFGTDTPPSSPPYWWEYKDTDYMVIYNIIEAKLKEQNV